MVFSETTKTHAIGPRRGTLALVVAAAASSFPLAPFFCEAWRPTADVGLGMPVADPGVDTAVSCLLEGARG